MTIHILCPGPNDDKTLDHPKKPLYIEIETHFESFADAIRLRDVAKNHVDLASPALPINSSKPSRTIPNASLTKVWQSIFVRPSASAICSQYWSRGFRPFFWKTPTVEKEQLIHFIYTDKIIFPSPLHALEMLVDRR